MDKVLRVLVQAWKEMQVDLFGLLGEAVRVVVHTLTILVREVTSRMSRRGMKA